MSCTCGMRIYGKEVEDEYKRQKKEYDNNNQESRQEENRREQLAQVERKRRQQMRAAMVTVPNSKPSENQERRAKIHPPCSNRPLRLSHQEHHQHRQSLLLEYLLTRRFAVHNPPERGNTYRYITDE